MATKTKVSKRLSKPEKVTNEELNKMQTLIQGVNKAQFDIGGLELQKHRVMHTIASINDAITLLKDEFNKQYGTDDVNIENGVINYNNNEQADKKD